MLKMNSNYDRSDLKMYPDEVKIPELHKKVKDKDVEALGDLNKYISPAIQDPNSKERSLMPAPQKGFKKKNIKITEKTTLLPDDA